MMFEGKPRKQLPVLQAFDDSSALHFHLSMSYWTRAAHRNCEFPLATVNHRR
jgi:hypothetical protein